MKDYQNLIGLLAIALAIYLGITDRVYVNELERTEFDACMEFTEELSNKKGFDALQVCLLTYGKS